MPESERQDTRIQRASRQRREHEKEELRAAILQAAAELFQEVGYQGFSMRQVAERIGYTVATLYLYFKNKDELLLSAIGEAFLLLERHMLAIPPSGDKIEHLRQLYHAYVRFGLEHPAVYSLMFLERPDFLLRSREQEEDGEIPAYRVLFLATQAAIEAGSLHTGDPRRYADALWVQAHGTVALAIRMPLFFPKERALQAAETALDYWLAGVRP